MIVSNFELKNYLNILMSLVWMTLGHRYVAGFERVPYTLDSHHVPRLKCGKVSPTFPKENSLYLNEVLHHILAISTNYI